MIEPAEILQPARERIEEIGAADLVVGVLAPTPGDGFASLLAGIRESTAKLYTRVRTVVVHSAEPATTPQDDIRILPFPPLVRDFGADPAHTLSDACHALFAVSESLHARATVVLVSDLRAMGQQWIYQLIRPALELDFDLVTPCYSHSPYEGLLNTGIVAPFTRALYGRQLQHPLGPDFAFSARLTSRLLAHAAKKGSGARARSLASIAVDAMCDGFEICQANLGDRRYPQPDWTNQSAVLAQVLDPVFAEAELHAPYWQRIRGSQPVPVFGEGGACSHERASPIDVRFLIELFQLGHRNLQEIWGAVLPPGALLELNKLARLAPEQFRMPDRLWARIIYDFALGHRLRIMSQDHLLRAMTPLYLAWVASYVLDAIGGEAADRSDRLALAFEAAKPYAVSRWRWPDRFNP